MASSTPALRGTDSGATDSSRLPGRFLLDDEAYIDDRENATTAEARSSTWPAVKVSFFAADPPDLSHFCVHSPGRLEEGRVLYSVDDLALISITLADAFWTSQYYLYRAGRGRRRRPALQHVHEVDTYLSKVPVVVSVGILPHGGDGDGDGFVLAALVFTLPGGQRELHVFRSQQGTWTKNELVPGSYRVANVEKVIAIGDGKLGFVDLWKGILVCDVIGENPMASFIPLPKVLPNNLAFNDQPGAQLECHARSFRDVVVCNDGSIKCVELERCYRRIIHVVPKVVKRSIIRDEVPDDVSVMDILHDSDLMPPTLEIEEEVTEEEATYENLGWRVVTWSREISSTCWRKESLVHADDIRVNNPIHTALLAQLGGSNAASLTLKDLCTTIPSLSPDDSNALYLISKVKSTDQDLCVLMVDMGKKTVEDISPILTERPKSFRPNFIPCSLSKYLNADSDGTQIGGQNDSWSASSTFQEGDNKFIKPSNDYPRTEYYSDYSYSSPVISPGTYSCYGNYSQHQQPAVARPLWPRPPPPSDGTRIGWRNASWPGSSTFQPTQGSVNQWTTPNDHYPTYTPYCNGYCYSSATTPSNAYPCYGNYQQRPPPPPVHPSWQQPHCRQ